MAVLSKHIDYWQKIGVSEKLRDWIKCGVSIPFIGDPPECEFKNHRLSLSENKFVDNKIAEYVQKSYVSEVPYKPKCVTPIGCTKKKGRDQYRLISDMRFVNNFINVPNVRYEDLSSLPSVIKKNDYYASIDLKDGFNHLKIKESYKKYFGFKWRDTYYQWNVLNFGSSIAPYLFTKILRPVVTYLRENGIRCILYVDDFLICGQKGSIASDISFVISTLQKLGWQINYEKSILEANQYIEYLGLIIENVDGIPMLRVPKCKISKIKKDINRILRAKTVSARVLAKITGQCLFVSKAVLPGKLMLRNVYRLLKERNTWETQLDISEPAKQDLLWWVNCLEKWNGRAILTTDIDGQLITDASHIGWGGHYGPHETQGCWDPSMARQHSNVREITAVLLSLKAFRPLLSGKSIQILSDNVTTVAYINHMGGPIGQLTDIAKLIWREAISNNITIIARHLSGRLNSQADLLSRQKDKHEWRIARGLFHYLDSLWGPHTIDRFASMTSTQLPVYNTRFMDPNGMAVDALAQKDWAAHNNFVNPPFRMIEKVLDVIVKQNANATIIAPMWPAQTWFRRLQQLCVCPPIRVFKQAIVALNPATPEPLRNPKWKVFAWRISGMQEP